MQVSVSDAKAQLTDLVRRVEAGDDVVLTRHGHAVVRLVPIVPARDAEARRALMEELRRTAVGAIKEGPSAACSQDDLYGEDGLPL